MTEEQMSNIVEGMVAAGCPRDQAVAVACALEAAQECPNYAEDYGRNGVKALDEFIARVGAVGA